MHNSFFINISLFIIAFWTIVCKVYAVWLSAKNNQKRWFVAMLVLNTIGVLEIFYIFKIAKKTWIEVKDDFRTKLSSIK